MYSSYESEDEVVSEEDEEGKLYQYIFELAAEERKKKEEVQIPTSSGNTPVNVETDAEPGPSAVVSNTKKLDVKAEDKTPLIPAKSRERKPWNKPGADISDYFNYGFNEESWKNYSKKQYEVRDAKRKLHSRTVQRGRTTHEEEEEEEESRPYPDPSASRRRRKVIGGRTGSGSRDEGRRHRHRHRHQHRRDGNHSQMATKTSRHKDRFTSYDLPTSSDYSSLNAFNPSPSFADQSRPSPASSLAPMDRYSQGFDGPSTSWQPCSSGVSSFIPRTSRAGLTETSRTRERYMQDNCDRDRSRKHSRVDKDRRGRDRDNENWPSSHSVEERMKHRDTAEQRGHKHHGDRSNAEKQQQHGENRPRDGNKDRQNPSCSSSRRDDGEDRDAQHKKKKEKSKRNTEHEKEERNLKHD